MISTGVSKYSGCIYQLKARSAVLPIIHIMINMSNDLCSVRMMFHARNLPVTEGSRTILGFDYMHIMWISAQARYVRSSV